MFFICLDITGTYRTADITGWLGIRQEQWCKCSCLVSLEEGPAAGTALQALFRLMWF